MASNSVHVQFLLLFRFQFLLIRTRLATDHFVYSCFEKGCSTEKHQSVRDNTERHDGLWLFAVASSSSRVFRAMEGGAMNTCLRVLKETKWILSFNMFIKIYLVFPRPPFGIVAYAFMLFLDNLCRNSCIRLY